MAERNTTETQKFIMTFHSVTQTEIPENAIRIDSVYRYDDGSLYPYHGYTYDYENHILYFDEPNRYWINYAAEKDLKEGTE